MRRTPRLSAVLIAASIVLLSPGLPCYQALAVTFQEGAPKGVDVKSVPALDLGQVKNAGVQVSGAGINAIPETQVDLAAIPVLPAPAPGLATGANLIKLDAEATTTEPGAVERPSAETTLRLGAAAIEGGKEEERGGLLSWFWSRSRKDGGSAEASVVSAQNDLSGSSVSDLAAVAKDQSRPYAQRLAAVRLIANRSDDPAKLALEEIGTVKPVGDRRDYEVRRHALSALASMGKLVSMPAISPEIKQELLSDLSAGKKRKPYFDYDGTLEPRGAKAGAETGAALKAMDDAGRRPTLLTGRPYAAREPGQITIQESLSTLTPEQKKSFDVMSDRGARSFDFDKNGEVAQLVNRPAWSADEQTLLKAASSAFRWKHGTELYKGEGTRLGDYSFTLYLRDGVNLEDAVAEFRAELKDFKLGAEVTPRAASDGRPASILVNKYDKSTAIENDSDVVGDYFFGDGNADAYGKGVGTAEPSSSFGGVDGAMLRRAKGVRGFAVGGTADPRLPNVFVWDKTGHEGAMEIAAALAKLAPAKVDWLRSKLDGPIAWARAKWDAPGPAAPKEDDPINMKTLMGLVVPRLIGMSAYMLVTLALVGAAVPVVGWTGYGIVMSLSPMAGIIAANVMGPWLEAKGARNAFVIINVLRVVSLSLLPIFHLFDFINMGTLIIGGMAEGFLLSSMMTTEGSFVPALFPKKNIGDINGSLFMMFPAVQVLLGLWAHIGRFADGISPFKIYAAAALLNLLVITPLIWFFIPNAKLTSSFAAAAPAQAKAPWTARLKDAVKKNWKTFALITIGAGVFAGLTWGLPALAAAGVGGKMIATTAAYLKIHPALTAPLPIVGALMYWIFKSDSFQALRRGNTATPAEEEKQLYQKRGELASEIAGMRAKGSPLAEVNAKEDELADVSARISSYRGRQLKTLGLMALGAIMFYPMYLVAAPQIAEILVGKDMKLEMAGQFLGALFFGNLISTSANTKLPGFSIPLPRGRKIAVNTTRVAQAAVVALTGLFMATKVFAAGTLLGTVGIAAGAMAAAAGLIALASRVTDRGWIKGAGIGFGLAALLPFTVWTWPALLPFLTIKTAMLLGLLAAGFVNGPNFVSMSSYLMRNTELSENSKVTGVSGAFFNAAIAVGYSLLTIASGFLHPAYPAVLAILGLINLIAGGVYWRTVNRLPGLSATIFKPKAQTNQEAVRK